MWKTCISALNMRIMKVNWNLKTKCVTDFLLTVRCSSTKDYTWHYVVSTYNTNVYINFNKINLNFEIFCLHVTRYLNTKGSFPICMFVVMASGKSEIHTYFTFLQWIVNSTHMKQFNIFLHNICRNVQHSLFRSR